MTYKFLANLSVAQRILIVISILLLIPLANATLEEWDTTRRLAQLAEDYDSPECADMRLLPSSSFKGGEYDRFITFGDKKLERRDKCGTLAYEKIGFMAKTIGFERTLEWSRSAYKNFAKSAAMSFVFWISLILFLTGIGYTFKWIAKGNRQKVKD